MAHFDDIDTPVDDAILSGDADDDHEALAAIAGDEDDDVTDVPAGDAPKNEAEAKEGVPQQPRDEPRKDDQTVPRARLNEVTAAKRAAEERAEALEAELAALRERASAPKQEIAPSLDLDAKEREYLEASYAGDTDAALAIRREIQAEERRIATAEARAQTLADIEQREAVARVQQVAQQAVTDYPFLNDNDGNNAVMDDVLEWRDFYAAKGLPPADALERAVSKVAPEYARKATSAPAPAPKKDPRREAAAQRAAQDAGAQPPAMEAGIGNRAAPPIPRIDSQEDWDKLPAAERERMLM